MIVGGLLGRCFRPGEELTLDATRARRWEFPNPMNPAKPLKLYQFWRGEIAPPAPVPSYAVEQPGEM